MNLKPVYLFLLCVLLLFSTTASFAQQNIADSLTQLVLQYKQQQGYEKNKAYITALNDLSFRYTNSRPDTSIVLANEVIRLAEAADDCINKTDAQKNLGLAYNIKNEYSRALQQLAEAMQTGKTCNYTKGLARIYHNTGIVYSNIGNYPQALENYFTALKMREELKDTLGISSTINGIGAVYFVQGKYDDALKQYQRALQLARAIQFASGTETAFANIGEVYYRKGNFAEARANLLNALAINKVTDSKEIQAFSNSILGAIFLKENNIAQATDAYLKTIQYGVELSSREYEIRGNIGLSEVHLQQHKLQTALQYANQAVLMAKEIGHNELLRDGNELLSTIYEKSGNGLQALYHHKEFKRFADSINNQQTEQRTLNLAADYEYSKKELLIRSEFEQKNTRQNWIIFSAFAGLFSALVVAFLIFRSRQKQKRSNLLLQKKNAEIDAQKNTLEKALTDLKAAQQQLIQAEKMASLGELTAGIAHEIQNPLNFVNNFSDVSRELIEEMNEEIEKGNYGQAKELAADIKSNLDKILHHGKRADGIVKGMLQHSRTSSGVKEPTDINILAEEYLRLSYHGLRARDKSFNAKFETDLDPSVPKVNIIPQEVGRVILNIVTNAFYAVNQKRQTGPATYEPTVTISTRQQGKYVAIRIKDNGNGIPEKIVDKIFQPFFTTKPTGEGTGLGLSLSYEIITKSHGGELKVNTKESEGTEFIILLPA
ncbi:MAG TPA: tetratricopeptide repeat protein [Lacibacter sp.]|nr:tetratricopeptide repeat protein [Lacibacter sp.]